MAASLRAMLKTPVAKAAVTSGTVMLVGDVTCQALQGRKSSPHAHQGQSSWSLRTNDWARSARFGLVGLTLHGPFFLHGFRWLDTALTPRIGTAVSLRTSIMKAFAGNVTIFPVYVTGFFAYMGALEGLDAKGIGHKLQNSFVPTYKSGFTFWIFANIANFQYVPAASRVYYVSFCGLLWNAYLSWANQRYGGSPPARLANVTSEQQQRSGTSSQAR